LTRMRGKPSQKVIAQRKKEIERSMRIPTCFSKKMEKKKRDVMAGGELKNKCRKDRGMRAR